MHSNSLVYDMISFISQSLILWLEKVGSYLCTSSNIELEIAQCIDHEGDRSGGPSHYERTLYHGFHPGVLLCMYLFIQLFIHPRINLSIHLSIHQLIHLSIYSFILSSIHLLTNSSIHPSIRSFIALRVYLLGRLAVNTNRKW